MRADPVRGESGLGRDVPRDRHASSSRVSRRHRPQVVARTVVSMMPATAATAADNFSWLR